MGRGMCFFVPRKRAFLVKTLSGAILFWILIFVYLGRTSKEVPSTENEVEDVAKFPHLTAPPVGQGAKRGIDLRPKNKRDIFPDDDVDNDDDSRKNKRTTKKGRFDRGEESGKNKRNNVIVKNKNNNNNDDVEKTPVTFFPPMKENWYKSHPMEGIIPDLSAHRKGDGFKVDPAREEEADPNSPGAQGKWSSIHG